MSAKRLGRLLGRRWWLIAVAGVLAGIASFVLVGQLNSSNAPSWSGLASIVVPIEFSGKSATEAETQAAMFSAKELALLVNEDEMALGGASISANDAQGTMTFVAVEGNAEEAKARASAMRERYVQAMTERLATSGRLEELVQEIRIVQARILLLEGLTTPTTTPIPEDALLELVSEVAILEQQISSLVNASGSLAVDLITADDDAERADIEAQMSQFAEQAQVLRSRVADLNALIASLEGTDPGDTQSGSSSPTGGSSAQSGAGDEGTGGQPDTIDVPESLVTENDLELTALESRFSALQSEYEAILLALSEEPPLPAAVAIKTVPFSFTRRLGGLLGVLVGIFGAGALLVIDDVARKPIWTTHDLRSFRTLAEVPARPPNAHVLSESRLARSADTVGGARKRSIQVVAASLLESCDAGRGVIGVPRLSTSRQTALDLAVDVGRSLGLSGRTVLVVDAEPSRRPLTEDIPSLAVLLDESRQSDATGERVDDLLRGTASLFPNVSFLPAGKFDIETLMSASVGELATNLGMAFDASLVILPDPEHPISRALFQRVHGVMPIVRAGRTQQSRMTSLAREFAQQSSELIGAVLIVAPRRLDWWKAIWARTRRGTLNAQRRWRANQGQSGLLGDDATQAATTPNRALSLLHGSVDWTKAHIPVRFRGRIALLRLAMRLPTSRWRELPNILIIGGQRCGTSSLYSYLGRHPDLAPSLRKETQFFSWSYDKGVNWYRAHFPLELRRYGRRVLARDMIPFEATPDYLLDLRSARRAAALLPAAKLITLIRNPVDRAYSHYRHNVRLGIEQLGFAEALDQEEVRIAGELERLAHDAGYQAPKLRRYGYLTRGKYAHYLLPWLEEYRPEQILIVRSEDLYVDPEAVFQQILAFIGVRPWLPSDFRNYSYGAAGVPDSDGIPSELRERLETFFRPYNQHLEELLGMDLGWESALTTTRQAL